MKITIANAAQWDPPQNEFLNALQKLHKDDLVRNAIEDAQRQMQPCELPHHINVVKSRLLARHLIINQLCHPAHPSPAEAAIKKSEVLISTTVYGKPCTAFYKRGSFSVSHVANWCCCAYSACNAIGVDITAVHSNGHTLLPVILSKKETEFVRQRPPHQRSAFFAIYWAIKESILKALGLGLSSHLQMSDISLAFKQDIDILSITELKPEIAASTPALPVTVSLKDNKGEKWMYSCVQIAGNPLHIFAAVLHNEKCVENIEWKFESYQSILSR
ncbi:phosphopantetheinyl transferase-like protein [Leptomonas seymouri]|uniref:holo-[acyl-carrier-protein] synthase n=1 Tax=Leptomonas seymouri TaxID=5684 RepID=A0A0N1I553_LEPSE|nr:phosphopantetheinyl transferase-like protein [Leptomonas seymouri]|eukprot:KPI86715.1 phosphopantetheinyl transferase-like protein [Leptomonas seymouri]